MPNFNFKLLSNNQMESQSIKSMAVLPDKRVAYAQGNAIYMSDISSKQLNSKKIAISGDNINAIIYSNVLNGTIVSADNTALNFWDPNTGQLKFSINSGSFINSVIELSYQQQTHFVLVTSLGIIPLNFDKIHKKAKRNCLYSLPMFYHQGTTFKVATKSPLLFMNYKLVKLNQNQLILFHPAENTIEMYNFFRKLEQTFSIDKYVQAVLPLTGEFEGKLAIATDRAVYIRDANGLLTMLDEANQIEDVKFLTMLSPNYMVGCNARGMYIWDLATGKLDQKLDIAANVLTVVNNHLLIGGVNGILSLVEVQLQQELTAKKEPKNPIEIVEAKKEKSFVPQEYYDIVTQQIMFNPQLVIGDGYTYESETLTEYDRVVQEKKAQSPNKSTEIQLEKQPVRRLRSGIELNTLQFTPNISLRNSIQEFLAEYPQYWSEVYIPEQLRKQVLSACSAKDVALFSQTLSRHPQLLLSFFNQPSNALLKAISQHDQDYRNKFLKISIEFLEKNNQWQSLFEKADIKELLYGLAKKENYEIAKIMIEKYEAIYHRIEIQQICALAIKLDSEALLKLARYLQAECIYQSDEQGNTLLHQAAAAGKINIVQLFIADGLFDIKIKNDAQQTPKDLAKINAHTKIVELYDERKFLPILTKHFGLFKQETEKEISALKAEIAALKQQLSTSNITTPGEDSTPSEEANPGRMTPEINPKQLPKI